MQAKFFWMCVKPLQNQCPLLFCDSSWLSWAFAPSEYGKAFDIKLIYYLLDFWPVKFKLLRDLLYHIPVRRKLYYSCPVFNKALAALEILFHKIIFFCCHLSNF